MCRELLRGQEELPDIQRTFFASNDSVNESVLELELYLLRVAFQGDQGSALNDVIQKLGLKEKYIRSEGQ